MQRIPLDLTSVRAARDMRAGKSRDAVQRELGISVITMANIEAVFGDLSDALLAGIERVLNDRERLRKLISDLMHG